MHTDQILPNSDGSLTYVFPRFLRDGSYVYIGTITNEGLDFSTEVATAFCRSLNKSYVRHETSGNLVGTKNDVGWLNLETGAPRADMGRSKKVLYKVNCL